MYDKEQIYDEQIYPLMSKIIDICKTNDMQMLFSCYLKTDDNGDMNCTTYLKSAEQNNDRLDDAAKVIQLGYVAQKPYIFCSTITTSNL